MPGLIRTARTLGIAVVLILTVGKAFGACTVQTPCAAPPGVVGQPYSATFFANGGTPPYSNFSIISGALPPGISMTADSAGAITFSGIPTSAVGSPFVFVVNFTDTQNNPVTPGEISIAITGPPGPPSLYAAPGILSFTNTAGASGTVQQSVLVQDASVAADGSVTPGGGTVAFTASVAGGSPWVSLSPASGSVAAGAPVSITVTVSTKNLKVGSYRDVIQISSASGSYSIVVTVFASNDGPILSLGASGVRFDIVQGFSTSLVQNVAIVNTGDPASTVNWTATVSAVAATNTPQFVVLNSPSGQANATTPGVLPIAITGVQTLAPGPHYNLIEVTDNNASNSPQYISVVLNVVAATGNPTPPPPPIPVLSPAGLVFTGTVGQNIPSQPFTVNVSTSQFQNYATSPSLPVGQKWLAMSPATGSASVNTPATINVKVNTNGLPAGIYQGLAEVYLSQGTLSVNITLILAPFPSSGAVRLGAHPEVVSGCSPTQLVITETGIANGFTVPAGWPSNLIASVNDDCGNPVGTGSVAASFSNGDPPLTLVTQGPSGQYSATWQPQNSVATANITLLATASGLQAGKAQITGTVAKNTAPVLTPHGIVNTWNPLLGGALAPGTASEVFGANLSTFTGSTTGLPLPTAFQNTQLIIGGRLAPLYYLSNGQVNAQIPAELTPGQQFAAVAVVNGALTLPISIDVVAQLPAVLQNPDGSAVAADANTGSFVSATTPAHPGDTLVMYVLGMGATNPPVLSGNPAPSTGLAYAAVQPTVTVDNQNAQVQFAGLTPTFVGLYQINFVVPATAKTGNLNVVVTQGTAVANATTIAVGP